MRNQVSVLSKRQLRRIINFSKSRYKTNDFNHSIDHMMLTVRIAKVLAKAEGANEEICLVAAYLHDIGRQKAKGKHGREGAAIARRFLKDMNLPPGFISSVCYAVGQHDCGSVKKTSEAAVLWDADKLQAVGPFGFIRIFAHHLAYDTRDVYRAKRLTQNRIDFFNQRFHTRTGRRLARQLRAFMDNFYGLIDSVKSGRIRI